MSAADPSSTSTGSLPNFGSIVGDYAQQFAVQVHTAVVGIDAAATVIAFYAGVLLIPLGAILYWGHVSRHMGKGLLVGGAILIILSYTLFPYLASMSPP